jgi:MFS transporter, ACS family, tartrate transporter
MTNTVEKRTLSRITWRIIPFVCFLYFIAFIDRVNIGFAALTMNKDIGLSPAVFGFGAGIFFLGYFIFEVPSNLILERVGARKWIARIMLTWGIISGAFAFVEGPVSFYVLRFLLGAAEAGFFPGIILYLSYWFPARSRARVTALFMAAAPISVALGSPISTSIMQLMDGMLGIKGWQWMFIMEAVPALLMSVVTFYFMTDRPSQAKWLPEDEKAWLVQTMDAEVAARAGAASHSPWKALVDPRVLALAIIYFGTSAGLYTLGIWAPSIIKQLGVSTMTVGFLNMVPPTLSVVAMYLWSWHSDRSGERTWHVVIACLCASIGLMMAGGWATGIVGVVLTLALVNVGISSCKPPLWSLPTMFLSGPAAAAGIAAINSIGNLGGFAGPAVIGWVKQATGSFEGGLFFVAGLLIVSAILTLVLAKQGRRTNEAKSTIKTV